MELVICKDHRLKVEQTEAEERTLARRVTDASKRVQFERTGRIDEMNGHFP